jgi:hypothetical protein
MLQVVFCLGGAFVVFLAMVLWANNGRFKSHNEDGH